MRCIRRDGVVRSAGGPRRMHPHKINTLVAVRSGSRDCGVIVGEIRQHAPDRRTARLLDTRDCLFDVTVHAQDIAMPLGREFLVPVEYCLPALQRVWAMGWPFHARRKLEELMHRSPACTVGLVTLVAAAAAAPIASARS